MKLNTNIASLFATSMVNLPSRSVCVLFLVPFSVTLAPGIGIPAGSVTFPVTLIFCKTKVVLGFSLIITVLLLPITISISASARLCFKRSLICMLPFFRLTMGSPSKIPSS